MSSSRKIRISNDSSESITLWLEPWGEDYGMLAGDELDVVASDSDGEFYFEVVYSERKVTVYAEGSAESVSVFQSGKMLQCGHKRGVDS